MNVEPQLIPEPHWLEYVKALGPAIIALFVAYIAWQQWKLARVNLREKLFDRRIEIFSRSHKLLGEASFCSDPQRIKSIVFEFGELGDASHFLFGQATREFLHEASERTLKKYQAEKRLESPNQPDSEFDHLSDLITEQNDWFHLERSNLFARFENELSFKNN